MIRRTSALLATVAAGALAISACSGATQELTDPTEILSESVSATRDVTSFHVDVELDGTFPVSDAGLPLSLGGTNLRADVDVENARLSATFAIPALLGFSGEVISADGKVWVKTTFSGDDYVELDAEDLGSAGDDLPVDVGDVGDGDAAAMVEEFQQWLETSGLDAVKLEDVDCTAGTCYRLQVELSAEELAALGDDALGDMGDVGEGTMSMTIRIAKDSLQFDGIDIIVDAADEGSLELTIQFSEWNESMTIEPPPADQVTEGDLSDILGGFGF
jgi:hypothetical protein